MKEMGGRRKNLGSSRGGKNRKLSVLNEDEEEKVQNTSGVDPETLPSTQKQQEPQTNIGGAAAEAALTPAEMLPKEIRATMSGDGSDKSSSKSEPCSHQQSTKYPDDVGVTEEEELDETKRSSVGEDATQEQPLFDWLAVFAEEKKNLDLTLRESEQQRSAVDSQNFQTADNTGDITETPSSDVNTSSSRVVDQLGSVFDDIHLRDSFNLGLIFDESSIEQQDEFEICAKLGISKFSPCSSPTRERMAEQEVKSSKSPAPETPEKQLIDAQFDVPDDSSTKKHKGKIESRNSKSTTPETSEEQLMDNKFAEPESPRNQKPDKGEATVEMEQSFTHSCQPDSATKDEPSSITGDVESSSASQLAVSASEVESKDANERNSHTMEGDGEASANELVSSSHTNFSPETDQLSGAAESSMSSEMHSCESSSELDATMFLHTDSSLSPPKEELRQTAAESSITVPAGDSSSRCLNKVDLTYGYEAPCEEKYKRYKLYLENVLNFNIEPIVTNDFEDRMKKNYYFLNRLKGSPKYFIMEYLFAASECLQETVEPGSLQERSAKLINLKVQEVISEARRTLIYRIQSETCLFHDDFSSILMTNDGFKPAFTLTLYKMPPHLLHFAKNVLFLALIFYGLADLCSIHCRPEQCIAFAQLSYALTQKLLRVAGCADAAAIMTHLLKQKMVTAFLHEDLHSVAYYCTAGPAYETIMKCFKAKVMFVCKVEIPSVSQGAEYPLMELADLKAHVMHSMSNWTMDDQLLWENTWLKLIQIVTTMRAFYSNLAVFDEADGAFRDLQASYQNLEKHTKVLLEHEMLEATSAVIGYYGALRCMNAKYMHTYEERCVEYKLGRDILVAAMELEKQQRPEFSFPTYELIASNALWVHLMVVMEDMWYGSDKKKVAVIVDLLVSISSKAGKEVCDGGAANESISLCAGLLLLDYTHDMPSCLRPLGIPEWRSSYLRAMTRGTSMAVLKSILLFLSYSAASLWTVPRNQQKEHRAPTYLRMLKIFSLSFSAAITTLGSSLASFKTEVKKTAQSPIWCTKLSHKRLPAQTPTYGLEMLYLPTFLSSESRATSEFRVDHLALAPTDEFFKTGIEGGKRLCQRSGCVSEAKLFDDVLRRSLNIGRCGGVARSAELCGLKNKDECYDIGRFRRELRSKSAVNHVRVTSDEIEKLKLLCCVKVFKDDIQDDIFNEFLDSVTTILRHVDIHLDAQKTEAKCAQVKKTITRWRSAITQATKICECGATSAESFVLIAYKFCLLLGFPTKPFLEYLPSSNAK